MNKWKMVLAAATVVAADVLLTVGVAYAGGGDLVTRRIPNPGTLVLLTSGFGALAWWTRRRR
jgi:hypothetical protein